MYEVDSCLGIDENCYVSLNKILNVIKLCRIKCRTQEIETKLKEKNFYYCMFDEINKSKKSKSIYGNIPG